jgi:hypothetical protein
MYKHVRQFVFLFAGIVLRWPLWLVIGIAGKLGMFRLVFLVYPTDEIECSQFCPNISFFRRFLSGRPTPGGLITEGWKPVGMYFVIPDLPMELARKKNRELAEKIVMRMRWIRKLTGAQTIGLAGQLGPIFERRHNIPMEPPIFSSINGNIFSIHEAIKWAIPKGKILSKQTKVAITGGGELGESLNDYLCRQDLQCQTVEMRFSRRGKVLPMKSAESITAVQEADIVINLLTKGSDFTDSELPQLMGKNGVVIDFSRPAIDPAKLKQKVYLGNRVQKTGMRFLLALPGGWNTKQLPACSLPALLAAMTGEINNKLENFCQLARQEAFTTALLAEETGAVTTPEAETVDIGGNLVTEAG